MTPTLSGIDHIHVYVANWEDAEKWYGTVLGLKRVEALMPWAVKGGPLTLENPEGNVHIALFERENHSGSTAIAFGASGEAFLVWKAHLENMGLELRITDHKLAYSLYFNDPDQNMHEITTYERDYVVAHLD
jgi:catechol 2,3-dioxygenase